MSQIGIDAARDVMTLADYRRLGNHLENKVINVRRPAAEFADAVRLGHSGLLRPAAKPPKPRKVGRQA